MTRWVLDEGVFACVCNQHDDRCADAIFLIQTILKYHQVVWDHEEVLKGKYDRFFNKSKLLRIWYSKLISTSGKVVFVSSKLDASVDETLDRLKFDPDDKCFVGAALHADKVIAAEDSDYHETEEVRRYFRDIGLDVFDIENANKKNVGII